MEALAIHTENLSKVIKGKKIIDDLNLRVPRGSIYGFLGPNGSGKTTSMKMLLGLSAPTAGNIKINGQALNPATRAKFIGTIGGLIEEPPGYSQLTGVENLQVVQRLLKLPADNVYWALDKVGLIPNKDKKVGHYSLGMKQRLGIALAIVSKPKLLVLDEPINGLDPAGIDEIRQLFQELAHSGTTIMVSSHILAEVEKIASHFGVLKQGKLVFQGERGALIDSYANSLFVRTPDAESVAEIFVDSKIVRGGAVIPSVMNADINDVCQRLINAGVAIHEISRQQESLEDVFMAITAKAL
ncbi:ABC transporter ATP-binding protein [Corynebacterium felinum]|uniref:ABC-2 type transport system ATP-binding protein n=1 Tax=Corynebacterium felinum TaxID=131318 RepID=A0ABU2B975_9CORY|nr:ABC transporter ATP-binding protein [Corynebacterium felinum]MDF5820844.1 ABC transporter ATP-binding protein [Corynebacterium felinum]MDR7355171.1 ABC-2 type transport system ATP-binding protein [Corynebacterium felinum]WJY94521.1 Daunorubicin/doxorubicin resistance ATP-binding protein DrrA [Corynebacterium felinum]